MRPRRFSTANTTADTTANTTAHTTDDSTGSTSAPTSGLTAGDTSGLLAGLLAGLMAGALALGLTACGDPDAPGSGPARDVDLEAVEYAFRSDDVITIVAGDTISFNVRNAGQIDHQLEVWTAENKVLGRTERIPPGATRSVTVTFEQAGTYRVICDIDDHFSRGQQARFDVADA